MGHRVLLVRPHLGEGAPVAAVGHEHGVVAEAVVARGAVAMVPARTPSAHTSCPSGNAASATVLKQARRAPPPSPSAASACSSLATLSA